MRISDWSSDVCSSDLPGLPQAYIRLAEVLGLAPAEVCMVAAHNNDLNGAQGCGLTTAFVARPTAHGPGQTIDLATTGDWKIVARDFPDLPAQAACYVKVRTTRLRNLLRSEERSGATAGVSAVITRGVPVH